MNEKVISVSIIVCLYCLHVYNVIISFFLIYFIVHALLTLYSKRFYSTLHLLFVILS